MKYFKRHFSLPGIIIIILFAFFCGKEAPTVNPGDYTSGGEGVTPGYFYPFVTAVYPTGGGAPLNTKFVIVFNMPVDADDFAAQITATGTGIPAYNITPATGASTTATINFAIQLPGTTTVTVTVGAGIHELVSGTDVPIFLTAGVGYTWTFTTGTAPDTTAPTVNLASRTPADGSTDISITSPGIQIEFSEPVNPSTINSSTFYLQRIDVGPTTIPAICGWSPAANPTTATLTPISPLAAGTSTVTPQYRVTVTDGITDIAGNTLSLGTTWTFTTESGDPIGGNPIITVQPAVSYVTDESADISWTTNEATRYTLRYGQGDNTGSSVSRGLTYFSSFHSLRLGDPAGTPASPALSSGRRYYARLLATDYVDYAGYSGLADSTTAEFNTATDEVPSNLDINDNSQSGVNWITSSANSGAFLFWRELSGGNYYLYGKLVDSSFGNVAGWGSRLALYNGSTTQYLSAVEDGMGGVIALATSGAAGIYAKRISSIGEFSNSNFNWGATADDAGDAGLSIGTGTDATAAPVFSGIFTAVANGTTEMGCLALGNPFVDYNTDLSGVPNGYVIMDPNNHNGTTVVSPTDYLHILGQTANIIASGDTFYIGDNVTNTDTFTARNHTMRVFGNRNNIGNTVYSEHGITVADLTALNIGVGDIIQNGANYGVINALTDITVSSFDSGTANADRTDHLIDGTANFTVATAVVVNDVAYNTTSLLYENISAVTQTDLTLDSDLFPNGNEGYRIYQTISLGTSDSYDNVTNYLVDSAADFVTDSVTADDIIINLTNGSSTTVISVIDLQTLQLTADIFNTAGGDGYRIISDTAAAIKSGTANGNRAGHLIDGTKTWLATVSAGDLVVKTSGIGAPAYATVTAGGVTDTDLTLSADIFPDGNEDYEIYEEYCTTHTTTPIDPFVRITVNWAIGVTNGSSVSLYNTVVGYPAAVTADTLRTNPLYDNEGGLGSVEIGDIVLNWTDGTWTTVNNITYRAYGALGLTVGIMADNEVYRIVRAADDGTFTATNIIDIGDAVLGGGSTLRTDGGATVYPGDVVYNLTDNDYGIVSSVSGFDLTLSRNALFNAGDDYLILRGRVLYAWQNGSSVYASIRSLSSGTSLTSFSPLITNAQNPYTVPDGSGNTYLVYEDISGAVREIRIRLLDAAGGDIWTPTAAPEISDQSTYNETILKVTSDGSGGVVVLYQYSNGTYQSLRAKRITSSGTAADLSMWGVNGYDIANPAATDNTTTAVDMAYNGDDVIVAAQIGNKIWARRVGTVWTGVGLGPGQWISNPATGTQNRPKIFANAGWTTARIVWEDSRFTTSAGYGIFGMQVNAGTGEKDAGWRANNGGTDDYNGVSVVLNAANVFVPNHVIVPYNSGAGAMLIWEDFRNNTGPSPVRGSDLLYIDIAGFTPY